LEAGQCHTFFSLCKELLLSYPFIAENLFEAQLIVLIVISIFIFNRFQEKTGEHSMLLFIVPGRYLIAGEDVSSSPLWIPFAEGWLEKY